MHYRHQAYRIWQDMSLPLAALPLPEFTKNLVANIGENWAEQMIASEKTMAWLLFPMGYLIFVFRLLLSPLTQLQKRLNIPAKYFWFCVGLAVVFLVWKLRN